jgi:hypothetical protein
VQRIITPFDVDVKGGREGRAIQSASGTIKGAKNEPGGDPDPVVS